MIFPDRVINLRQPLSRYVLNETIEVLGRSWTTDYRGPVWIYAHDDLREDVEEIELKYTEVSREYPPPRDSLPRGGVVGIANLVEVLEPTLPDEVDSEWYDGGHRLVFDQARRIEFTDALGEPGIYKVHLRTKERLQEVWESLRRDNEEDKNG